MNEGTTACGLPSIQRGQLDDVVLDALSERLFRRDRLAVVLQHLLDRSEETRKRRRKDLALAKGELTNVRKAVTNLLLAIESGVMRPDEALFVERMAHNRARQSALEADVRSLEAQLASSKVKITEQMVAKFGERMNDMLRNGDNVFRTAYVRLFVDEVVVSPDEICIMGSKTALERALICGDDEPGRPVPLFDREWCRLQDSNL